MGWLIFCISIFLLSSQLTDSQNSNGISIGQSLVATNNGSSWLSPSGDFAFGFSKFPNNTNLFLLSIWYAKIPETVVWYANHGHPVRQQSYVNMTAEKGLVLSDPEGNILWNTANDLSGGAAVSHGYMNDTGNFVLKSSNNNDVIWQSFNYPKDTLLPTQVMEAGDEIVSRRSETNFTKGRFQLRFLQDGNLVLNTRDLVSNFAYDAYYISGTNDQANPENAGHRVVYDESGDLYIEIKNGSRFDLTPTERLVSVSPKDYYHRVTLNVDGILSWYYHPRNFTDNNTTDVVWTKIQSVPDDICTKIVFDLDSGACGFNSICSIGQGQRPTCQCPPSYTLLDPTDAFSSCVPNFKLSTCEEQVNDSSSVGNDEYKIIRLPNTNWPLNDYARHESMNEEECKSSCLSDCLCAVAIHNEDTSTCWKKRLPLSNGATGTGMLGTALLKVGKDADNTLNPPVFPPAEKVKYKKNRVVVAVLGSSLSVNFILLCAIVFGIFIMHSRKNMRCNQMNMTNLSESGSVHCFTYKELERATDKFKEEIGRGAFGIVYKGTIISARGDPTCVAVKKLDRISKDADKEFETEVNIIGQTYHKNLVRCIGFCKEDDQRLLVYEHMSNGTVADYIFGDVRPSWGARIQIAQGIARGLLYLHDECSRQIIHCDIKPQNILLDEYQNARISDFGLAKLLALNQTHTNTAIRGTKGYVAPEWFRNKAITVKVDVYSFGVLLLEIICCRRSVYVELIEQQEGGILTDWAFDCYQCNRLDTLVNEDIEALNDIVQLKRLVTVALWCVQEDPSLRPTMRMVTQMIEGVVEVPDGLPSPSSFSVVKIS